ncbi:MAG: NAD(P)/FAD-dependent oxidoreductase [Lachnospiraceae bacterium]|nr:NAD(P)/FAD-dependent oxidoreductase [Lachnospiraceae bacterium]
MTKNSCKIIVVGGGAAGMMAAIQAARRGAAVLLFEKNEKLGKKIYITGKGRCNVTNACDIEELLSHMVSNKNFMYSSFYTFTNEQTMDFFENTGCPLKIERGNRVFPISDKSSDVIRALSREMRRLGVRVLLNARISELIMEDGRAVGVFCDGKKYFADAVIVATGGVSYPSTGSTGDGYRFAKEAGHSVKEAKTSLVPFEIEEDLCRKLQGLSLRNCKLTIYNGSSEKKIYEDFGELLFTHFGISGPTVISASAYVGDQIETHPCKVSIDLKPALSEEQLDRRILRDFEKYQNKQLKNALGELLPKKMIPVIIELSGMNPEKKVNIITKEERKKLLTAIKKFTITTAGLRGFDEAIITRGGIKVKEIDPGTMESKIVKRLYFAGEVLDLDAVTGGFNLQIAWSTGYAAGVGCVSDIEEEKNYV